MANEKDNKYIPLSKLPLSNDFMFGEVMTQENICKMFLEELLGKKIDKIVYIERQMTQGDSYTNHGIRLDVYLSDDNGSIYNIEMQTTDEQNLEKRSRFYQSGIDRRTLNKGRNYKYLKESFVIFVCTFDYYHKGFAVYERESYIKGCEGVFYDDGSRVFILNSNYRVRNASLPILEFLDLIKNDDVSASFLTDLAKGAAVAVKNTRLDKGKEEAYMTFVMKQTEAHDNGVQEGRRLEVYDAVLDGDMSPEIGAKRLGLDIDTFTQNLEKERNRILQEDQI